MIDFNPEWYGKFIQGTNEKDVLVSKISDLLEGKPHNSCLEIGLGLSPYFAEKLAHQFNKYVIVEKGIVKTEIPDNVILINKDWENLKFDKKFDVIIASHVIYYFKDKKSAIEKMFNSLNEGGRIIFVVNGKSADYGPLKLAFAEMIKQNYVFTYDELVEILNGKKLKEYTLPSKMNFSSFEDLFEILRLSFDTFPEEYQENKEKIINHFKENLKGNRFILDQKIIEAII